MNITTDKARATPIERFSYVEKSKSSAKVDGLYSIDSDRVSDYFGHAELEKQQDKHLFLAG